MPIRMVTHTLPHKTFQRRILNRILHQMARNLPGATTTRPFLHKLRGVRIKGKVFIADDVYLENEYPEQIEIHRGTAIGIRSIVIAHNGGPGRIVFHENVWVGIGCIITANPGQTLLLGKGSSLASGCVVTRDVPPYTLVAGIPARPMARITSPVMSGVSFEEYKRGLRPLRRL